MANTTKNTKTATTTKKSTRSSAKTTKTTKNSKLTSSTRATKLAAKSETKKSPTTSIWWRIFWTLICAVVSTCLLIAVDDAIFGTCDRVIANYDAEQSAKMDEDAIVPISLTWEEDVTQQLAKDIFVPIAWGTLFTLIEAYILYKARLLKRNATSAILIVALWLLPIALAAIRLISCYAFTYQIAL